MLEICTLISNAFYAFTMDDDDDDGIYWCITIVSWTYNFTFLVNIKRFKFKSTS